MIKKTCIFLFLQLLLLTAHVTVHAQEYDTVAVVKAPDEDSVVTSVKEEGVDYEKETPKGNFKSIYEDSIQTFVQRKVPDSTMKSMLSDDDFWYLNYKEKEVKKEKEGDFWEWYFQFIDKTGTKVVLWSILILLMIGAIFIYLKENNISLFTASSRKISSGSISDEMPENIFEIDYEVAIQRALDADNYRLATRYLFLRSLKTLSSRNVIEYAVDKTNFDYYFQLSDTKYQAPFRQAARSYEYLWYGKFDVNHEQFNQIKNGFDQLQNMLA